MFYNEISKEAVRTALEKPWIENIELLAAEFGMKRDELNKALKPIDIKYLNDIFNERSSEEYKSRKIIGVLDTSIVGYPNFLELIRKNFESVIITDLTLDELNWLKDKPMEKNALSAQALLRHAAEDKKFFKVQRIKRIDGVVDSDMQIIKFVKAFNNQNIILVTADAGMSLRAEGEHVNCIFLKMEDYDRMQKIELDSIFKDGIAQNEPSMLIKNSSGFFMKLPHKLEVGDEVFKLSRESVRGKKQTIFKHMKCIAPSELVIIRKVFIKDDEPCLLFNYNQSERETLIEFVNNFRGQKI